MVKKKPVEPDEMRMPADEFDEIMRRALGVPSAARPANESKKRGEREEKGQPEKP